MQHPYTGVLVVCAEFDGEQHPCGDLVAANETCDSCGMDTLETCTACKVNTSCCRVCRHRHALECPWPL